LGEHRLRALILHPARDYLKSNKQNGMSNSPADSLSHHERLTQLRATLLPLHKALVDSERVGYEQNIGTIPSANHFLKLLTDDPWFAWLHPLSELIVTLDEALDSKTKTPLTDELAAALMKQTARLLVASEDGDGFGRNYFEALQRDPDVVMAHAAAAKIFRAAENKKG
jgi:hypothetical protein